MISDYLFYPIKSLRRRKLRSWLTMLGIFIGIAAVVSLISLGSGLKQAITGQFSSLSADNLLIQNAGTGFGPPGSTAIEKLTEHDVKIIEQAPGVKEAITRLIRIVKIEFNNQVSFNYIASMPQNQKQLEIIYDTIGVKTSEGRLLKAGDRKKIVLGSSIAEKNNFEKKISSGNKVKINNENFEVIGILEKSSVFQVNHAILMMEDDMKALLDIEDEWDIILVKVADKDKIEQVAEKIKEAMRKDRDEKKGEEDFSVQTPLQAISAIETILNIINIVVIGIAAISLIVGGIGIMNTMYTSVLERTREIGIMKAIGAKNSDILSIFLIESGLLGLIGGMIGIALGLFFAYIVSAISSAYFQQEIIDFQINLSLVLGAVLFSVLIGIFAGLTPAYRASRLNPVEALRG